MQKDLIKKKNSSNDRINGMLSRILHFIKPLVLPVLLSIFPSFFHYGNNAAILILPSLERMLIFNGILAVVLYICFIIFNIHQPVGAANAAFIFLLFFNFYTPVYNLLLKLNIVQVEQYTFLPFFVLLGIYAAWLITKIKVAYSIHFWNIMTFIFGMLIIFNILKIIPTEINKIEKPNSNIPVTGNPTPSVDQGYPDIYFIVLDEFSGFEPMREYWHYSGVDNFIQFLKSKGFFVAEKSHSSTQNTLYELAARLNYQDYPCCDSYRTYFEAIGNSKVAQYLKTRGYTTVAFEELRSAFPSDIPFRADYFYESDPNTPPVSGSFFDDFGILVTDNTMMSAFSEFYKPNVVDPFLKNHRNMIYFTTDKLADLKDVSTPKFVYIHLLLPHVPFMFDASGNVIDQQYRNNWNYYLGNYIFTIQIAENMVNNILSQADPKRLPIIILQSDHGARNQIIGNNENSLLKNFPEEFKTNILYTLYIPGYDISGLPQDVNPMNTFPIIFNYLFSTNIPLK